MSKTEDEICNLLISKGELKQRIFTNTMDAMHLFKETAKGFEDFYKANYAGEHEKIPVLFTNKNMYEFQLRFAGDVLIFLMHTNVFEFPRDHEVMRTPYIKEDKERSYCGTIHVFNFLADSFKYNRINDAGYLIGRILINKDQHYYIDGKRELAQILNSFNTNKMDHDSAKEILFSAIQYTANFDLLVPNYTDVMEISLRDMIQIEDQIMTLRTAKRMGFSFQPDDSLKE